MKKILALLIIAAMMICAVLPVSAAARPVPTDQETDEIFHAYLWQYYEALMAEPIEGMAMPTFEQFSANRSIEKMEAFEYYGRFGEEQYPVWFIAADRMFGFCRIAIGNYFFDFNDYYVEMEGYPYIGGLYVFDNGKLTLLSQAYADGMVTDADLKEMNNSGNLGDMMRQFGDMDNNKVLNVADIMALKDWIMKGSPAASWGQHQYYADADQNGLINVGDIMALKNHIMQNA